MDLPKILEVTTTRTAAFKQIIQIMSKFVSECNLVFVQPNDNDKTKGGIRCQRLTNNKEVLFKLNLAAANFECFKCDEPEIRVGLDIHKLSKKLKMINDGDPITIYMNHNNRNILYIDAWSKNNYNNEKTEIEISLLDIANFEMPIPKTLFQNKISMASGQFHTICRKLHNNYEHVEIMSQCNEIMFTGYDEESKVKISHQDENCTVKDNVENQIIKSSFNLRSLVNIGNCNKLCNTIDIYFKNDFPLVLVISVATLGKFYIFVSPIMTPDKETPIETTPNQVSLNEEI